MTEKKLGKISSIRLGEGGYQDAMFGVSVSLSFNDSTGVGDFRGGWSAFPKHAEYTREQWAETHVEAYDFIRDLMRKAKARDFNDLKGKPVEAEFDGMKLVSWRILEEVL